MSEWKEGGVKRRDFRHVKGDPELVRKAPSKPKNRPVELWFKYRDEFKPAFLFVNSYEWKRWKKYTSRDKAEQALKHLTNSSYFGVYYQFEIRE